MTSLAIHIPSALRRLTAYRSRMQATWLALGLDIERKEHEDRLAASSRAYHLALAIYLEYRELLIEQEVLP